MVAINIDNNHKLCSSRHLRFYKAEPVTILLNVGTASVATSSEWILY